MKDFISSIPFGPNIEPIANAAVEELERSLATVGFNNDAFLSSSLTYLIRKLSKHSSAIYFSELNYYRLVSKPDRLTFEDFENFVAERKKIIDSEYPRKESSEATLISEWHNFAVELAVHFLEDIDEISSILGEESLDASSISAVEFERSDRHHEGKTVCILSIRGSKIVYKPKSLGPDRLYELLLSNVNLRLGDTSFYQPRFTLNEGYGWYEYVDYSPAVGREETQTYYMRLGRVLGVLFISNSTDCHFENLICKNATPVVVDHETICSPQIDSFFVNPDSKYSKFLSEYDVLSTSVMPTLKRSATLNPLYRNAAILPPADSSLSRTWKNINTIDMTIESAFLPFASPQNIPNKFQPKNFESSLIKGFVSCLEVFIEFKNEFQKLFEVYGRKQKIRFILRPTEIYGMVLKHFYSVEYHRNPELGDEQITQFLKDDFRRNYKEESLSCSLEKLVGEELEILKRGHNIPLFHVESSECAIYMKQLLVSDKLILEPPLDTIKKKLDNLSGIKVSDEVSLIRKSLEQI